MYTLCIFSVCFAGISIIIHMFSEMSSINFQKNLYFQIILREAQLLHTVEGLLEYRNAYGADDPEVSLSRLAEYVARRRKNMGFFKQFPAEFRGTEAGLFDAGKR